MRDPSVEGVAKAAESDVDISGIGPQRSRQVKATGRNKMMSYNDMMAGVQAGDATALKTFFKYSSDPAKAEELLRKKAAYLLDSPSDSVAKIKLGKAALAASDSRLVGGPVDVAGPLEYGVLNNMKKDMEDGTLDEPLAPAVVPARTSSGAIVEGKFIKVPRMVGSRPMTKRDTYMQQVDELRPDVNPAGVNMIMEELAIYDAKKKSMQAERAQAQVSGEPKVIAPSSERKQESETRSLADRTIPDLLRSLKRAATTPVPQGQKPVAHGFTLNIPSNEERQRFYRENPAYRTGPMSIGVPVEVGSEDIFGKLTQ
jgi:hypothetical protein